MGYMFKISGYSDTRLVLTLLAKALGEAIGRRFIKIIKIETRLEDYKNRSVFKVLFIPTGTRQWYVQLKESIRIQRSRQRNENNDYYQIMIREFLRREILFRRFG